VEPDEESQRLSLAAHQTMYEVLVTVAHLLAPFTPFVADEMYCNLVGGGRCHDAAGREMPVSVHLSRWPEPKPMHEDRQLLADMALAQRVVGLGRAAREGAALRLRQPLAEAIVGLPSAREADALLRLADVVTEELNVKSLRTAPAGSDLVDVAIHPLPKQLGSKHGRKFPAIRQALLALDPLAVAGQVESGQSVTVNVDGEIVEVLPDEVQVRKTPKAGLAVAQDGGYLVAVTTELTDDLRWEGWARELSRNIQELRKKSGFEISDRIYTTVGAGAALQPVLERFGNEIATDTLSLGLGPGNPEPGAFTASLRLDGEEVVLGVRKA
jgi:isoleucyl-tRNA synthetase